MRKTIITVTGAAFLGLAGSSLTPAPASAFAPLFFAPLLASKYDPNFKAVNPYEKKKVAKKGKKKSKR
jgi:hypothetical protein